MAPSLRHIDFDEMALLEMAIHVGNATMGTVSYSDMEGMPFSRLMRFHGMCVDWLRQRKILKDK